jgi:hypothetical protein
MKVIDLTDDHLQLYFMCLEDWSEEMKEAGTRKELWYKGMVDKGLRVKLALDDREIKGTEQAKSRTFSASFGGNAFTFSSSS